MHCPDFYIKKDNLLIDIKSRYIYNKQIENMKSKKEFAIKSGYRYEIYIFDRNGKMEETI